MADELSIVCRHCGRSVLMHNMTKDKTGINMICLDCAKKERAAMAPEKTTSIISTMKRRAIDNEPYAPAKRSKAATTEKSEKMIKYLCTNCKYKFSRKASQSVEKCPYCSKHTIVVDNALGADKLLKDSMDKRFEGFERW